MSENNFLKYKLWKFSIVMQNWDKKKFSIMTSKKKIGLLSHICEKLNQNCVIYYVKIKFFWS